MGASHKGGLLGSPETWRDDEGGVGKDYIGSIVGTSHMGATKGASPSVT